MKNIWIDSKIIPPPGDRSFIGVHCFGETIDWIFLGKAVGENLNNYETNAGIGISYPIAWWAEAPVSPEISSNDWVSCRKFPAPVGEHNLYDFILFDGLVGITESQARSQYHYRSEYWSCGYDFEKPLFWRPFPRLPLPSVSSILQI
jgi:hypothetical protein